MAYQELGVRNLPFEVVEPAVSRRLGRRWCIRERTNLADLASHPAFLLSDGLYSVFVKFSDSADGRLQFETELAGLQLLGERAQLRVPAVIGIFEAGSGCFLVLEAVRPIEPAERDWRQIGAALARIHSVRGVRFGFAADGFLGPVAMDNGPMDDWPEFYVRRRLEPAMRMALDSGHLARADQVAVEKLIERVPELSGPPVRPTLLHGDAQRNNWIHTADGPLAIDPAVYYGHPEMDLAFLDIWQPVPACVLEAYAEHAPLYPGYADRLDLWRVWGYLLGVAVEGPIHRPRLVAALSHYV